MTPRQSLLLPNDLGLLAVRLNHLGQSEPGGLTVHRFFSDHFSSALYCSVEDLHKLVHLSRPRFGKRSYSFRVHFDDEDGGKLCSRSRFCWWQRPCHESRGVLRLSQIQIWVLKLVSGELKLFNDSSHGRPYEDAPG